MSDAPERLEPRLVGGQIMVAVSPEGGYVTWDDYEALRKENERLTEAVDVAQEATKFARLDRDMYKAEAERLRKMVSLFAYCEDSGTRAKLREELHVPPRAALQGET